MRTLAGIIFMLRVIWLLGLPFIGLMIFLGILGAIGNFALGGKDK